MQLELLPILPELLVAGMAALILIVDLYLTESQRRTSYVLTLITLFVVIVVLVYGFNAKPVVTLNGMFVDDAFSDVIKIAICAVTLLAFVYSRNYIETRKFFRGEYYVLGLYAVVGMMVMASAAHFLVLYLGLELLSLCLYAMVALQRDSLHATEAAIKYFVLGAIGSGMMLYGMSLVYGLTGSLDINQVRDALGPDQVNNVVLLLGVIFIIVSLAFKLGVVPFHMWVPDVYHGAATATTLFLSTAPKIAAFAMLIRLLIGGLEDLHVAWRDMVVVLSLLSIAIGNLIAIAQSNFKRMLAYSAISHMGFMLLGVISGTASGYAASLFYVLTYALMGLGGFGMILLLSRTGFEADELADLKGLNQRSPWSAFLLMLLMVSMAGVPPTIGFVAKLSVIYAVIDVGLIWLAVVAVLFAVVGAYYYLRVVWYMYFEQAEGRTEWSAADAPLDLRVLLGINACALVLLLPFLGPILQLCADAVKSVLGV